VVSVVESVTAELAALPDELGESGLASVALAMAERVDDPNTRPTAAAVCARELREALTVLRAIAPPRSEDDDIERARKRRVERLAGKSAAGTAASS
jgi:hypothetical protein